MLRILNMLCQENKESVELWKMSDKKTHLNLKVDSKLKAALETFAKREKRSLGNLSELLLEWSLERLSVAGTTMALLSQSTSDVELTSHISKQPGRVTKEEILDDRLGMGAEIVGANRPKKKTHRSKAS